MTTRVARTKPGAHAKAAPPAREVTLALVKYTTPLAAASLPRAIDAESALQAASPAYESARLLTVFGVGTDVIRAFALLLIGASAVGLFVALTQALDERRYDLAIMRALGASRTKIVAVLAVESILLSASGLVIGLALAHAIAANIGALAAAGRTARGRCVDVARRGVGRRGARLGRGYNGDAHSRVARVPSRRRGHACRRVTP